MVNQSSKDLYEFKKALMKLSTKKGKSDDLVSIYVPPSMKPCDVLADISCEEESDNLKLAIEAINQRIGQCSEVPDNGMAVFAGMIPEGGYGCERMEVYVLEPLDEIDVYWHEWASEFFLDPLKAMADDEGAYGFVVLDRCEATIAYFDGESIIIMAHVLCEKSLKESANDFLMRVGGCMNEEFMPLIGDLKGIVIGGPCSAKVDFAHGSYLSEDLKSVVVAIEDVSYTNDFGIHEVVSKSAGVLSILEILHEKKLLQRFFREVGNTYSLAAYGDDEVIYDLSIGAVDTLLLSDDFDAVRKRMSCLGCGFEKEFSRKNHGEVEMRCPCCGELLSEVESFDLVDFFVKRAEEMGSDVEFISKETTEGMMLSGDFGGIAAILRYPVEC